MWLKEGLLDLTYCTNIHAGESWEEVRTNVAAFVLNLKERLSPEGPFGIGLRLSAAAAEQLLNGSELDEFKTFLESHGLYVALLNGFPYGSFNCGVVKSDVFAPDWRDESRVLYTLDLVRILMHLLPQGMDGGISTLPLSYKPWLNQHGTESNVWPQVICTLTQIVAALVRVCRETGKTIHLDIEPEPDGLVENTAELIRFFDGPLTKIGAPMLAGTLTVSEREAREYLFDHIRVCFDTCHMSVEYEDPIDSLRMLQNHGVGVGRIQVSSALHVRFDEACEAREQLFEQLRPFAESVYLHQVIERSANGSLSHYPDLGDALIAPQQFEAKEWRIHYHVPIFAGNYGSLSSNLLTNREVLSAAAKSGITSHLEIETYTWDVLPASLKIDMLSSIAREYQWVMDEIGFQQSDSETATIQRGATLHE